jgi:hypothetical protein
LMRELDKSGLEFIKKDCEKRISQFDWVLSIASILRILRFWESLKEVS